MQVRSRGRTQPNREEQELRSSLGPHSFDRTLRVKIPVRFRLFSLLDWPTRQEGGRAPWGHVAGLMDGVQENRRQVPQFGG